MSYTKQNWEDRDLGVGVNGTPVNAEHLNHMEDGIKDNSDEIESKAEQSDVEALKTEVSTKAEQSDVDKLSDDVAQINADLTDMNIFTVGTAINSGDDLNDYTTCGKYYANNSTIAGSLSNAPTSNAGFALYVLPIVNASTSRIQFAVRQALSGDTLFYRVWNGSSWRDWMVISASTLSLTSLNFAPEDA